MTAPIVVSGAPGSPFTRKMLAVLRYRRIPYRFLTPPAAAARGLPAPKVALLPTLYFEGPDGGVEAATDSSPLIRRLETLHAERAIVPPDPALAFLDRLIEDYADEWLTKPMFHYRWAYADDIRRSQRVLPFYRGLPRPDDEVGQAGEAFAQRQIGRLRVVGSSATTAPVIEDSYKRFLTLFDAHLRDHPFLLGGGPATGDFACYGQLTQLALFDPTPMGIAIDLAPRVFAWTALTEDLSGHEPQAGDWLDANALPDSLRALFAEIGRVYAPVMLANARAVQAGAAQVETSVAGRAWRQDPFPYQAKCLAWLREAHAALDSTARATVGEALGGTGCGVLFR